MAKLSVCIEAFWKDLPFEERVRLSGELGFKAVEFWGTANKDVNKIKAAADAAGVCVAAFGCAAGGMLVDPTAGPQIADALKESLAEAKTLGSGCTICVPGKERKGERSSVTRNTVVRNLKAMAPALEDAGVTLCIEPLNPIVDHPGYWLTNMSDAADICYEVDSPRVKILMDLYHQQITEGNLIANLRQYAGLITHYHCAGVPGRHDLVGGEQDYRAIFRAIDGTGYQGHVGLDLWPEGETAAALKQAMALARP